MKRLWLSTGILALLAFSAPRAEAVGTPLKLFSFQVGGIGAYPVGGGTSHYSGQVAWTPTIHLGAIGIRGEVGAALFKNTVGDSFLVLNYEGLLQIGLLPNVKVELGGGMQTWTKGNGGTAGVLSAGLTFGMTGTLDRIYATYSRFLLGTDANEIKLGIGLVF